MSANRGPSDLDAAAVERLIRRQPVAGHGRLVRLLAAASAPAQPGELHHEDAARAAFRNARASAGPLPAPRPPVFAAARAMAGKILTVKVAALCIIIGGTGGVALAARTGNLPDPIQRYVPGFSARHHPHHTPPSASRSARPSQSPPPYPLLTLCLKYEETDPARRAAALREVPELRDLAARIGGPDPAKADAFCGDLHRAWPNAWPTGQPTGPSAKPAPPGLPAGLPAGGPTPPGGVAPSNGPAGGPAPSGGPPQRDDPPDGPPPSGGLLPPAVRPQQPATRPSPVLPEVSVDQANNASS